MRLFSPRSKFRSPLRNEKATQKQQQNNDLGDCFACTPILLPLHALFQTRRAATHNSRCPPPPPIAIPTLCGKVKTLARRFASKLQKQPREGEAQRSPWTPCSIGVFTRGSRRSTGDSDSRDSYRSIGSIPTRYSRLVSPAGSACNFRNSPETPTDPETPTSPETPATTPSVGFPATPKTPVRSLSIGYPTTPITPPPPLPRLPCGHMSLGLGKVCKKCADTAMACELWMSGIEEADSALEQGPPGFEPIPETPLAKTCEDQSSPLPEIEREKLPIGLGIEMPSAGSGGESSLLINPLAPPPPPPTPPPPPKKRKERPPPVLTARHFHRRISWKFEKNCDTASATASSGHTGATFAPPRVQDVSEDRSTFENFPEVPCTLEHSGRRGGDWAAATVVGSNRDSCTTLVASMHNDNEGRPERKWHFAGAYCAPKHRERCPLGVGNRLKLSRNKRCVSWMVEKLVMALTKCVGWLRVKGWCR